MTPDTEQTTVELSRAVLRKTRTDGEVVLQVQGLRKSFGGETVLDGVDLSLHRGDVILLRGPNGSGKTTLLNILTGNLRPDAGTLQISANGRAKAFRFPTPWWANFADLSSFRPETMAKSGLGRSWQEMRLFSTLSLGDNIAAAMPHRVPETPLRALLGRRRAGVEELELLAGAEKALAELGLGDRTGSSADMISLGQAKRVAIARAVLGGARVLFLDEPLGGLDAQGTRDVLSMLRRLAEEHEITLVITEHVFNMPLVLDFANVVWTLRDGRVEVEAPADAARDLDECFGDGVVALLKQRMGEDTTVRTTPLADGASLTTIRPAGPSSEDTIGEVCLEVNDLTVTRSRRVVVGEPRDGDDGGLSLTLRRGELAVLEAPNGWGKTTLLDALGGSIPSARGTIALLGRDITRCTAWERRKQGLSLLQAREHIFPALTVREMLSLSGVRDIPDELAELATQAASSLSGGEKQRTAFACFMGGPRIQVALLDEPFSALDADALSETWDKIRCLLPNCAVLIAVPGSCSIAEDATTGRVGDTQ